jgi:hypothetical protein
VDVRRPQRRRELPTPRRRHVRRRHQHLRAGRVQRRRHLPGGGRLSSRLAADQERDQPRPGPRAAPRPHLPADRLRPERRQRRALDAARRHPEPQRGSGRAARPLGQRRLLLAGPHALGAGRGVRLVPRLRPGLRTVPRGPPAARGPRRRPAVARRLRPALPDRRPEHPRLADRRRRRRLRGGGARSGRLRPRRGRPRVASYAGAAQRGHRRARRRRRPPLALRGGAADPDVPQQLACLGVPDARSAVRHRRCHGRTEPPADRASRRIHLRALAAHLGRPGQRSRAVPDRRHPDRLRGRLPGAEPDRRGRSDRRRVPTPQTGPVSWPA